MKPDMTCDAAQDYTRDIAEQLAAMASDHYVISATIASAGQRHRDLGETVDPFCRRVDAIGRD
jgi:hypothetical protein